MEKKNIVTMPGDGIGKTLLPEALRVLDAVGFKANYIPADIGWEYWRTEGDPLPRRTLDLLEKNKIGTVRCNHFQTKRPGGSGTQSGTQAIRASFITAPSSGCASISTSTSASARAEHSRGIRSISSSSWTAG